MLVKPNRACWRRVGLFKKTAPIGAVPTDAEVLICLTTLDRVYADEKRFVEAAAVRRDLLKLMDRVYGADNFQMGQALFQMAQSVLSENRPEEGKPLMLRSLAIAEKADPMSMNVGQCLLWLGTAEYASGNLEQALKYWTRACAVLQASTDLNPRVATGACLHRPGDQRGPRVEGRGGGEIGFSPSSGERVDLAGHGVHEPQTVSAVGRSQVRQERSAAFSRS